MVRRTFSAVQGSGKTYTMTGGNILSIGEKDYGIVPRAVRTIFETIQVGGLVQICEDHGRMCRSFRNERILKS